MTPLTELPRIVEFRSPGVPVVRYELRQRKNTYYMTSSISPDHQNNYLKVWDDVSLESMNRYLSKSGVYHLYVVDLDLLVEDGL